MTAMAAAAPILKAAAPPAKKARTAFRDFHASSRQAIVERHYRLMRANQTVTFYDRMVEHGCE